MSAHTPGPWRRAYNYGSLEIEADSPDEPGMLFTVAAMISERDMPVLLAAPDLYAALQSLLGAASLSAATGKPFGIDSPGIVAARAALHKAGAEK